MSKPLEVGDVLHGYAHGLFGRDWYHCARIEALAADWMVVRGVGEPSAIAWTTLSRDNRKWVMRARDERFFYSDEDECEVGRGLSYWPAYRTVRVSDE